MAMPNVKFTFPPELIKEPILYDLAKQSEVVTDIRRADTSGDKGWVVLELEGRGEDIERGIAWVTGGAIRVDPVVGYIVEG
jgi:hypothetical protein